MKLTEIDTNNINNDIIKDVLFKIKKSNYSEADCMIIFGCHLKKLLDERLDYALEVLNNKIINKIILTGGFGTNGDFNEAEYMNEILLKNNISSDKIIIENRSKTTEENIINCLEILKNNNLLENKRIVILSNDVHFRRIKMELVKKLKNIKCELLFDYPENSYVSYDNIIMNEQLRFLAINEIKKIISFIKDEIIDDEEI